MGHTTVKELPESERPYERFWRLGAEALTDAELLAIILKSGTRELTSLELAQQLLSECKGNLLNLYEFSYEELLERKGIGPVKAMQLKAIAELSNRISQTSNGHQLVFCNPESVAIYYMEMMRHRRTETFLAAFFDGKGQFLGDATIADGGRDSVYIMPAELFQKAVVKRATQIIVLHNHPSGDPNPSEADLQLTKRLVDGAKLLGMYVSDHIIIGDNWYYSFCENSVMPT